MSARPRHLRPIQALLDEVVAALRRSLGSELLRVSLFGSQARGTASGDSDVGLLVVVARRSPEIDEVVSHAIYDVMERHEFEPLLAPVVLDEPAYRKMVEQGYSFARNVERERIDLWNRAA